MQKIYNLIPIYNKISQQTKNTGSFLVWIKGSYKEPLANIIRDGERWNSLPLIMGKIEGCLIS